jgi:nucleoside-diphosphate kinase
MAEQLTSGPCIALEIRQENAVNQLRKISGPHDPEVCRLVR